MVSRATRVVDGKFFGRGIEKIDAMRRVTHTTAANASQAQDGGAGVGAGTRLQGGVEFPTGGMRRKS